MLKFSPQAIARWPLRRIREFRRSPAGQDVKRFGWPYWWRNRSIYKAAPGRMVVVDVPGFGAVNVRTGGSDYQVVCAVLGDEEYRLRRCGTAHDRVDARYRSILGSGRTPVIIDAGANIGTASIWFSKLYPDAKIVAIEPENENFAMLQRNVARLGNVSPVRAAIGSQSGFVNVLATGRSWGRRTARAEQGCPVITIGDAVSSVPDGEAFIAKIDIEGFEADLFESGLEWIDGMSLIYLEPHEWMLPGRRTSASFQAAMGARRWEIYPSGENLIYINPALAES